MPSFTKREARKLAELSELARARELNHDLHHIVRACGEFRSGHIDEIDLDELLREYVQGTSRLVLARYEDLEPDVAVARAVALELLEASEVPPALLKKHEKFIAALKQVFI
jgi:hypothetical protein